MLMAFGKPTIIKEFFYKSGNLVTKNTATCIYSNNAVVDCVFVNTNHQLL